MSQAYITLTPARRLALMTMILLPATVIPFIDYGMLVALPNIQYSLHASSAQAAWLFFISYVFSSVFMAPSGRYGDFYGRIPIWGVFLFVFLAGTILCAIGQNIWVVYVGRALLGVGVGGMQPLGPAIINSALPFKTAQRMIILWGFLCYFGFIMGCFFAGLFADTAVGWRMLAWISLGLLAPAIVLLLYCLRFERPVKRDLPIDWLGILLVGGFQVWLLILFTFGPVYGWTSPIEIVAYILTPFLFVAFIAMCYFKGSILIHIEISCRSHFIIGAGLIFLTNATIIAVLYLWTNFSSSLFGLQYSLLKVGVCALIIGAPMVVVAMMSSWLYRLAKPSVWMLIFSLCGLGGALSLMMINHHQGLDNIWWRLVLLGFGFSLPWLLALPIALRGVTASLSGAATSAFEVVRYTGNILIAMMAASIYHTIHVHTLARLLKQHTVSGSMLFDALRAQSLTPNLRHLRQHASMPVLQQMSLHAFYYAMIPIVVACALTVIFCLFYVSMHYEEMPGQESCH